MNEIKTETKIEIKNEIKIKVTYSKTERAKYIAHLNTIDVISKAIRRLGIPYEVSNGCHVRPKLTFGAPLPMGHASFCECFFLVLKENIDLNGLAEKLSLQFPSGMKAMKVELLTEKELPNTQGEELTYKLSFNSEEIMHKTAVFLQNPDTEFSAFQKKKLKTYTIGSAVQKLVMTKENDNYILNIDFIQGQPKLPSVSKIIIALTKFLGEDKINLINIERLSFNNI